MIFLLDFAINLRGSKPKRAYFIGAARLAGPARVDPDLRLPADHGAVPVRPARAGSARITRLLRGQAGKDLVIDVLKNRSQYATFITILLAGMRPPIASLLVLQFESRAGEANIKTGGDALWWGIVTITTVGYGDFYPVTTLGRLTGVFVMFAGIGIIGALASILASLLVAPPSSPEPEPGPATAVEPAIEAAVAAVAAPIQIPADAIAHELAGLRAEIAALRASLGSAG